MLRFCTPILLLGDAHLSLASLKTTLRAMRVSDGLRAKNNANHDSIPLASMSNGVSIRRCLYPCCLAVPAAMG